MPKVKTQALCIRVIDYSETSQVVWFFSPTYGRMTVMAKGSKRATRQKPAMPLETAALYDILFYDSAADMGTLAEYSLIEQFPGLRRASDTYFAALYVMEICRHVLQPRAEASDFFHAVLETLNALQYCALEEAGGVLSPSRVLSYFQIRTLEFLGAAPEFTGCVNCGARLKREKRPEIMTLAVNGGGIVCKFCREGMAGTLPVARKTAAAIETLRQWGMPATAPASEASTHLHDEDWLALHRIVQPLLTSQLERPMEMHRYCFS